MAIGFLITKHQESHQTHAVWGYARAFCEAGLIGALADWFAVVALFRHPLGQQWIPHTAIIPKNKAKIARSVSQFFHQNFFDSTQVTKHLQGYRLIERACEAISRPQTLELISTNIQKGLPNFIRLVDDSDLKAFLKSQAFNLLKQVPIAPFTSKLLSSLTDSGQHHKAFNQTLRFTGTLLQQNLIFVEERVALELKRIPSAFGIKDVFIKHIAAKIVSNVQTSLETVIQDPEHPVREQFHQKTLEFIQRLEEDPELKEKAEELKREFLESPSLALTFDSLWSKLKDYVLSEQFLDSPHFQNQLYRGISEFVQNLQSNPSMLNKLETWLEAGVCKLIQNHGHELEKMIHDTILQWDEKEVAAKLEEQVGDDLQYIRINGSIVGGAVGVLLHFLVKSLGW